MVRGEFHRMSLYACLKTKQTKFFVFLQYKQFRIQQDQCAMKVCTDACIFGAWFAEKIPSSSSVLDIGSGTGLLMLMLAQKNKSEIDGIEVDLNAYKQQKEHIEQSPWKDQLRAF